MTDDSSSSIAELCFPKVEDSLRPHTGQIFATLHDAVSFYKEYAKASGFQVRMGTIERAKDGTIRTQYALCNRQGVWVYADVPRINPLAKKRKTTSCKADCKARVIFQVTNGGYYLRSFNEGHSHLMVPVPSQHFMPSNRNVGEIQQMLIMSGIKANIGPMRTFRMVREMVGSYKGVGCTSTDFKNYVRDLKVYNKGSDAHMLLEALSNKQDLGRGFKFFYDEDEDQKLRRLIWADESSVKNFDLFGEAISFDATYNTNRYKMIFTPFTGRDNHGKCISFGAALISREDTESYAWVLDKFVEIMGRAPRLVITDQDPGLKKAVASSWKDTRHRYCMWHISMKVAEKVPIRLRDDPSYKSQFDNIIWSDHEDPDILSKTGTT